MISQKNNFNIQGKLQVKVLSARGRKNSSTAWLQRHLNDKFVNMAQRDGFLSRAAYKLIEIDNKFSFLSKAKKIVDLGASPGGWSQVVMRNSKIDNFLAVDLLEMEVSDKKLTFLQGDFNDLKLQEQIVKYFQGEKIDLVLSDMAPNFLGHKQTDSLRSNALGEEVLYFCRENLVVGGHLVMKSFKGSGETELITEAKKLFTKIICFKPEASRKESSEYYLIGYGLKSL